MIRAIDTTPSGRLIRKIHRHEAYCASDPPRAGPSTAETPQTLDSQPCTRPRSSRSYKSPASVLTVAMIEPAPTPCRARNAIRLTMLQAAAHSADPVRNTMVPTIRIGLRPHRSASFPYTGMVTVWVSRYAENTQLNSVNPPRSRTTCGIAVATIVLSMADRAMLTISAARTGRRWRTRADVAGPGRAGAIMCFSA